MSAWTFVLVDADGSRSSCEVRAARWFDARAEAARMLGCDPQRLVTVRGGAS